MAFRKINKSSHYDRDDLFSLGLEVYMDCVTKWDRTKVSTFETFLNMCLISKYVKVVRDTFAKKRGGAGCKQDDIRFGRGEKWQTGEISVASHISIDKTTDDGCNFDLPAIESRESDYELLAKQMRKFIPKEHFPVYKQLIDPDETLRDMAVQKYKNKAKFQLDNEVISRYLGIEQSQVRISRETIGSILQEKLGIVV